MRIQKVVCDKCKKEIKIPEEMVGKFDLCEECAPQLIKIVTDWVNATLFVTESELDEVTDAVDPEPIEVKDKPKKVIKKAVKDKSRIDWDKACALKIAGWSNKEIAAELHINEGTVNSMIYHKVEQFRRERG